MQNTRNIKNMLKNTNNNYLILRKYQGNYPKYLKLNKYLELLKKKGKYNGLVTKIRASELVPESGESL